MSPSRSPRRPPRPPLPPARRHHHDAVLEPALTMAAKPRTRELVLLVMILGAYAVSLGRTIDHGYVWDDVPEIETNASFDRPLAEGIRLTQVERGASELAQLGSLRFGYDSYRPLLYASYWADIALWGRSPGPMHRTNVLLGGLAIVLAYLVSRRWLGATTALVPTAVFALHPIQIETVAYLSARGDLLAGLFALAATYAALRGVDAITRRRAIGWAVVASASFAASLLSKEAYVALPLAIAAIAATRPGGRARWRITAALAAVAIAYLPVRAAMLDVHSRPPYGDALVAFPGAVLDYLRSVIFPFDLSIERQPRTGALVGWSGVVLVSAMAIWLVRRVRAGTRLPPWAQTTIAGLAWLLALLGPSIVVVHTMNVVADRYLYVPLLGLAVAATAAGARLANQRPRWARPLGAVAILWSSITLFVAWRQVPVWRDVSTLYRHAVEMAPGSSRAQYRVAVLELQTGNWELAVPRLERAIELDPRNVEALNNLGVYLLRQARYPEAEAMLRRAVDANPARFNAWNNLGLAQLGQGKRDAGCASIARALEINQGYEPARRDHARACTRSRSSLGGGDAGERSE